MRIVRPTRDGRRPSADAIFVGDVATQAITGASVRDLRALEVHFTNGGRNRFHTHTTEQILVITDGDGIVATRSEERAVSAGDIALIPAGEEHWHGAQPGKDMTHIAINGAASETTITEEPR